MGSYEENIIRYLNNSYLKHTYCVTSPQEKASIYEKYCRQLQKQGEAPVPADQVLCLATGMACRDEDQDISREGVMKDANDALSCIYKRHESKLSVVVLEIGLDPEVYVPEIGLKKSVVNREDRSL